MEKLLPGAGVEGNLKDLGNRLTTFGYKIEIVSDMKI